MGIVFLVLFWCLVHEPAALEKLLFSFGDSLTGTWYACLKVQLGHTLVMGHSKSPTVMVPSFKAVPLGDGGIPQSLMTWVGKPQSLWSDRGCRRSINQLLQHPHKVGKQAYPHFSGRQLTHGEIQRTRSQTPSVYVSYCLTMSGEWFQSEFLLDIVQGTCLLAREPFWQLWPAERVEVPSLAVHWSGANAWGTECNHRHRQCEKGCKKKQNMVKSEVVMAILSK